MKFTRRHLSIAAGIVLIAVIGGFGALTYIRRPRLTPELRGFELAGELGCFACHGPGATGGVPNPGSDETVVPAWDGGNAMMYVRNEREIEEWILFGHPERLKDAHQHASSDDPAYEDKPDESGYLPLSMPAYENVVSDDELKDLVAYYKAVATFEPLPPDAREGYRLASRLGCFGCHGPGGRVGSKNPGSFKGYVPPWRGQDFEELVADDTELRQWILEGNIDRFESNPAARHFTERQVIRMPAYRSVLDDSELESLIDYIHWLQAEPESAN
jgi:mono/diheme cytochrome c family protein